MTDFDPSPDLDLRTERRLLTDQIRELELRVATNHAHCETAAAELEAFRSRRLVRVSTRLADALAPRLDRLARVIPLSWPPGRWGPSAGPPQGTDQPPPGRSSFGTLGLVSPAELVDELSAVALDRRRESLVSVIMPTHNRARLIGRAIESALEQTHEKLQLIIVDDGSTDDTAAVVARYQATTDRITMVNQQRAGPARARNRALELARGDFCAYLDSDNVWTPRFLEVMVGLLIDSSSACGYAALAREIDGNTVAVVNEPFDWGRCRQSNLVDLNVLVHRAGLPEAHFDPSLGRNEDWDLVLRLARRHQMLHAPFIGCRYRDDNSTDRVSVTGLNVFTRIVRAKHPADGGPTLATDMVAASLPLSVSIRVAAPFADRLEWGDHHLANAMARSLAGLGHRAVVRYRDSLLSAGDEDVNIVLRGAVPFAPRPWAVNVLWIICDPEQVEPSELQSFDLVRVASASYAALLNCVPGISARPLLQASGFTPPEQRRPLPSSNSDFEADDWKSCVDGRVLFVGNSRGDHRPLIDMAVAVGLNPVVVGSGWDGTTVAPHVVADFVDNRDLPSLYRRASWVLNDHWPSMVDFGIVSNRLFDVLAAGGMAVSDRLDELATVLPSVVQVDGEERLAEIVTGTRPDPLPWTSSLHLTDRMTTLMSDVADWVIGQQGLRSDISPDVDDGDATRFRSTERPSIVVVAPGWSDGADPRHHLCFRSLIAPLTSGLSGQRFDVVPAASLALAVDHDGPMVVFVTRPSDVSQLSDGARWPDRPYVLATHSGHESAATVVAATEHWGRPLAHWELAGSPCIDPRLWRRYHRRSMPPPEHQRQPRIIELSGIGNGRPPTVLTPAGDDGGAAAALMGDGLDHYRLCRLVRGSGPFDLAVIGGAVDADPDRSSLVYEALVGRALGSLVVIRSETNGQTNEVTGEREGTVDELGTLGIDPADLWIIEHGFGEGLVEQLSDRWPDLRLQRRADRRFPDAAFWHRFGSRAAADRLFRQWPEWPAPRDSRARTGSGGGWSR
ncbi:MAG: glycosyltransferase family 2 protein [Acidimicrobiia bacterium]|nr:glycosyltransferase family 2 protein [Acidimicrobiia bacterium]